LCDSLVAFAQHSRHRPIDRKTFACSGRLPTRTNRDKVAGEGGGRPAAGNRRLRHIMIELAWLWLRHQPGSALSGWFRARVGNERGRIRRITIVALARKLLIALWRYVTQGEVPEGAVLKAA
jgi:transposase